MVETKADKSIVEGFERVTNTVKHRMIWASEGPENNGKTHLALTMPGPIIVQNLDIGLEGVVEKFANDKLIYKNDYMSKHDMEQKDYLDLWNRVKKDYYTALASPTVKSIIMDTGTDAWELCRLALLGKLTQVQPYHYAIPNNEFKELIKEAYNYDKNVCFIHQVKDKYVDNVRTAEKEMAGFSKMGYNVQVITECFRHTNPKVPETDPEYLKFGLRIRKCRQNKMVIGTKLEDPMCSFPWLASMVFPDTSPEDWQ